MRIVVIAVVVVDVVISTRMGEEAPVSLVDVHVPHPWLPGRVGIVVEF